MAAVALAPRTCGASVSRRKRYHAIAKRIDNLALDQVLRLNAEEAPRIKWVLERGHLNDYILRTCSIDRDLVIVRVK